MTFKTFALAAASVATIATATLAAADTSYFEFQRELDRSSVLELGTVRSEGAGVVEIYSFHGDRIGNLLGTEAVTAGANADVRVNIGTPATTDVIALLKVDGQTVASLDYIID